MVVYHVYSIQAYVCRPYLAAGKIQENQKEELRKINSLGCRLLAPCWRSTPTRTLEILWDMMPLHILARGTALSTYNRIKKLIRPQLKGDIGYQKGHLRELMLLSEKQETNIDISSKLENKFWKKGYNVNQFQDLDFVTLLEHNRIRYIYTDGSGLADRVGSGFLIRKNSEIETIGSFSLGTHRSVYQGELKAIDLALDQLMMLAQTKYTEFRVDNQSILSRLKSGVATNELEAQVMRKLVDLKTRVTFRWVRSHKGIQGNEIADGLARQGAMDQDAALVQVPLPAGCLKKRIHEYMYNEWQQEWDNLEGTKFRHRNSKFWLKNIDPVHIAKDMLQLRRSNASLVIACISGHSTIKEHLKRSKQLKEDIGMGCRLCSGPNGNDIDETNEHMLDCSELRYERVLAFGTSDSEQIRKHWKIRNVAEFCNNKKVKGILKGE